MKNFAQVMGLLFGSARAHTYPKSGQVAPSLVSPYIIIIIFISHTLFISYIMI